MKKITNNGKDLVKEEDNFNHEILQSHSKDIHYLTFDRQLSGFSPLGCFISKNSKVRDSEKKIMLALTENKRVCSLYPDELLTLYPIEYVEGGNGYNVLLDNIGKHFDDILHLNDEVYKTKYMYVDFGHGANNLRIEQNYTLVLEYLNRLLQKSKVLEKIFFDEISF